MRKVAQTIRNSCVQNIELGKYRCNRDFEDLNNILWLLRAIQSLTSELAANEYATKQN